MTVPELMSLPFLSRDVAHQVHLATRSYANQGHQGKPEISEKPEIQNKIDEILAIFYSALYKLKFLA